MISSENLHSTLPIAIRRLHAESVDDVTGWRAAIFRQPVQTHPTRVLPHITGRAQSDCESKCGVHLKNVVASMFRTGGSWRLLMKSTTHDQWPIEDRPTKNPAGAGFW
jgi:hypothetical protein